MKLTIQKREDCNTKESYYAVFEETTISHALSQPNSYASKGKGWLGTGNHYSTYEEAFKESTELKEKGGISKKDKGIKIEILHEEKIGEKEEVKEKRGFFTKWF